ncbi:hypothetical protein H5P36_05880 [Bacillus sp. APMAM]|nr:hypothetical protein [Bacillus sp. APMAM]
MVRQIVGLDQQSVNCTELGTIDDLKKEFGDTPTLSGGSLIKRNGLDC